MSHNWRYVQVDSHPISRLTVNIAAKLQKFGVALLGWLLFGLYLIYEYEEYGAGLIDHLLSQREAARIIYHVAILLLPIVTTYLAYLLNQKDRLLKELSASEEQYRDLVETANSVILTWDTEGSITFLNAFGERFFGFSREELLGRNVVETIVPQAESSGRDLAVLMEDIRRDPARFMDNENENITKDGRRVWVRWANRAITDKQGALIGILSIGNDITERKKAEEDKDRLLKAISVASEGIAITDDKDRFIYLNDAHARIYGWLQNELMGKTWRDTITPELKPAIERDLSKNLHNRAIGIWSGECPALRKDGTIVPVEITATSRWDKTGKYLGHICIVRDISERKRSEELLVNKEKFIRNILDTVDEGFIVLDRDYRILIANRAYCRQIGEPCDLVIGRHCYEMSHKISRPCYEEGEECAVRHVFETGEPHSALHRHPDAKGSILYVETKAFPIKDSDGVVTSVIETINNITEKYLLEEERVKTQKLESIGTLAGGIAHDFNNLLQGVFGYISMAKMIHDQKEKSLAMLEQAEEALHMSVNLTNQLLTFSKGGKPLMKLIRLEPAIENAVKFALSGSHTDYRLDITPDLWPVEADAGQFAQVVQNIVVNANEAMSGRGTVTISACNMDIPAKVNSRLPGGGRFVRIDIQDTGAGISEQNISKIFDPYFTTKEKGSGLGMATSYSIIKNHGGLIEINSELNRGSTFSIYLPASGDAEVEAATTVSAAVGAKRFRILLMDDEDIVRTVAKEMLTALGHEVEGAEDGTRAIELFNQARENGNPFDIVIFDLTVKGGMGGEEAIAKIRDIAPDVKAVVSSGYADSPVVADYRAYGFSALLSKPYRLKELKDCLNLFVS